MADGDDAANSRRGANPCPADVGDSRSLADILGSIGGAAYRWDIASDALDWSAHAACLLRVGSPDEIATGRLYRRFLDASGPAGRQDRILRDDRTDPGDGVPYEIEYCFCPPNAGEHDPIWIEDCGRWFAGADGRPERAQGIVRVADERHARNARLVYRSDHDAVTGTLNRTRLIEELGQVLERMQRENGVCALAVVAIDALGVLNQAYGFEIADQLIAGVAARLQESMRRGDTLGRLSGNKIGVVLNNCSESDLRNAVERFARAVADTPLETAAGPVAVTVSLGGVVLPRYGRAAGVALARAQEALTQAQSRGSAGIALFEPSRGRDAARRRNIAIAGNVVDALNAGRVELALQPIVRASDRSPAFYEALFRLHLEDGTPVSASDFIETAERLGIVRLIDHRALDLAIETLATETALTLSINVSSASALDGSWFARLAAHLRRDRGLAGRLVVEITETMAITDLQRATDFVSSLRDLGCRVAIDDFGAGHTSFRSLRSLGADLVKIDGSFIEDIADSPDDLFFVSTLVQLAGHMNLETVAERVTNGRDAAVLRSAGIDYLQGHLFGEAQRQQTRTERSRSKSI